jgi:hypothetical protein
MPNPNRREPFDWILVRIAMVENGKQTLAFCTEDTNDYEEARAILSEVKLLRTTPLDLRLGGDLLSTATQLALSEFERFGAPTFIVRSVLRLDDNSNYVEHSIPNDPSDFEGQEFCDRFKGMSGVVTQVLVLCEDGRRTKAFQRDIPGIVSDKPSEAKGRGLDRVWIPNGYKKSVADLGPYKHLLSRRKRLYFDLANYLGLKTANDLFEVHVTVEFHDDTTVSDFELVCDALGVKAIHIELPYGSTPSHLITGSFHRGPLEKVKSEAHALAAELSGRGFDVTRIKIEAMIRNSLVPLSDDIAQLDSPHSYFEFHVKVSVDSRTDLKDLMAQCKSFGVHLSKNASNKMADGVTMHFATLRVYRKGRDKATAYFQQFLSHLRESEYRLSNILQEYAVYDTNITLDDGWFPD